MCEDYSGQHLLDPYTLEGPIYSTGASMSQSSGAYDAGKWKLDPKKAASRWTRGNDVEVHSKLTNEWLPAVILDEFEHHGESWYEFIFFCMHPLDLKNLCKYQY